MNRREMMQAATGALAVASCESLGPYEASGKEPAVNEPKSAPAALAIVDTHLHLWDLSKFKLPWLKSVEALANSYVMSDYLRESAGLNVTKAVYMEVDVDPTQRKAEADYVTEICRSGKTPMVAAVIGGNPAADGFDKYLASFKGNSYVKGMRQVLHVPETPKGYCLQKPFIAGVQALGEQGLSYDLCMRNTELLDAAKLIDACPGTRFILDHCGNASVQAADRTDWKKAIAAVAAHKNVVGKVSGIVANAKPKAWTADDLAPIINHTLEVFGPDRVMFGGDWPVCTLTATFKQWVEALKSIVSQRSQAEQQKLFADNAIRFYGLK